MVTLFVLQLNSVQSSPLNTVAQHDQTENAAKAAVSTQHSQVKGASSTTSKASRLRKLSRLKDKVEEQKQLEAASEAVKVKAMQEKTGKGKTSSGRLAIRTMVFE